MDLLRLPMQSPLKFGNRDPETGRQTQYATYRLDIAIHPSLSLPRLAIFLI